jgi:hypothetical protein
MCFTPTISLTTAIIEFVVASIILVFFKRDKLNFILASFIIFLGLYQFTEFMLCTSSNAFLWAKLGFVAYTFLPALALNLVMIFRGNNKTYYYYIFPVAFSFYVLVSNNFITSAECGTLLVTVKTLLTPNLWLRAIYWLYYYGFILLAIGISWSNYSKEKNKDSKRINLVILIALLISLVPAVILIIIFPTLRIVFPSMYCEFALLSAITAMIIVYLRSKKD